MARAVVTGGAGFLGSHVCERLLEEGWEVLCLDSLITGDVRNLEACLRHPAFRFERCDVTEHLDVEPPVEWVLHLASPASPRDYLAYPIETLKAGALGTLRGLELARVHGAGFLLASTSEVYGDPAVHPQPEGYHGDVDPVGPRAVYDEAKRYAEAVTTAFGETHGVDVRIARIFNTYGPRLRPDDGRAIPTFLRQALRREPITIHGDGRQTRSFCYVDDLIEGLWRLLGSDVRTPVNLGNPEELSMIELALLIRALAQSDSDVVFGERWQDDPVVRCPDISLSSKLFGWEPRVPLIAGLERTLAWARSNWTAARRGARILSLPTGSALEVAGGRSA